MRPGNGEKMEVYLMSRSASNTDWLMKDNLLLLSIILPNVNKLKRHCLKVMNNFDCFLNIVQMPFYLQILMAVYV